MYISLLSARMPWGLLLDLRLGCRIDYRKYAAGACASYEQIVGQEFALSRGGRGVKTVGAEYANDSPDPHRNYHTALSSMLLLEHKYLHATTAATAAVCSGSTFNVIEVGARTGVWSMTAAYLKRRLMGSVHPNITLVEPGIRDEAKAIQRQACVNGLRKVKHIALGLPEYSLSRNLEAYRDGGVNLLYWTPQIHQEHLWKDQQTVRVLSAKVCRIVVDLYDIGPESLVRTLSKAGWKVAMLPPGGHGACDKIQSGRSSVLGPLWNMHKALIIATNAFNQECAPALCTGAMAVLEDWIAPFTLDPQAQRLRESTIQESIGMMPGTVAKEEPCVDTDESRVLNRDCDWY